VLGFARPFTHASFPAPVVLSPRPAQIFPGDPATVPVSLSLSAEFVASDHGPFRPLVTAEVALEVQP